MKINRKEFIEKTCKFGTCLGAIFFLNDSDKFPTSLNSSATQEIDNEQKFTHSWIASLIEILDSNLDNETKTKIMEECGRACAHRGFRKEALKYRGNLDGLLAEFNKRGASSVDFQKDKGTIQIKSKKRSSCPCLLIKDSKIMPSKTFCICSDGWFKEIFETITETPVKVESDDTVLRGGKQCIHTIFLG